MAIVERYATAAGAGLHDGSSWDNAWAFESEAQVNAIAGDRVNLGEDVTLTANFNPTNGGTSTAYIYWRGCSGAGGSITDGNQGRFVGGTGPRNDINMPVINAGNFGVYPSTGGHVFENLKIIASGSTIALFLNSAGTALAQRCIIIASGDAQSAALSSYNAIFDSDIYQTNASYTGNTLSIGNSRGLLCSHCRITSAGGRGVYMGSSGLDISNCLVYGCGKSGIYTNYPDTTVSKCTIVNCGSHGIEGAGMTALTAALCMITDNAGYGISATAGVRMFRNRFRSNVSGNLNGLTDTPDFDSILDDFVDWTIDYTDPVNEDFTLVPSSPAYGSGGWGLDNIGAFPIASEINTSVQSTAGPGKVA